jgi:octaprenyl-diphosphate synthase
MSQVARSSKTQQGQLSALYAPIERELEQVEDLLLSELQNRDPYINELVRYGFRLGGKRLRPALLLLAAKAFGSIQRTHIVLAAAVEMIHTATLVHDDILDEATLRRHAQTVNARWNNETSVLLGDYLFTHSFYLASTLESTYACQTIGRATNTVCEGELRQTASRGDFQLDEEEYFQIIAAKTGALCACCCQLGAHYAAADATAEDRMHRYGLHLGIAFQIADDLLDFTGDEQTAGKSLGTDLGKHKPTLALIYALRQMTADQRAEAIAILNGASNGTAGRLSAWLARSGGTAYALEKARQQAQSARQNLGGVPWNDARNALEGLTEFVIERSQ